MKKERGGDAVMSAACNCEHKRLVLATLFVLSSLTILLLYLQPTVDFPSASFSFCLTSTSTSSDLHPMKKDTRISDSVVRRAFNPVGAVTFFFIQMGAYRGGPDSFAVVGLSAKSLHSKLRCQCEWLPHRGNESIITPGTKYHPGGGFSHVYTVTVVNCTFGSDVGADGSGGRLVLHATTGDEATDVQERFVAMEEAPGAVSASMFTSPPKYDFLYCGSPLYGELSPQAMREWVAYHARLFGEKSHMVLHNAGGIHPGVTEVLRPWMRKGVLTVEDIREQEKFDGYYHNQFLVLNDCLHRYRLMARWIFFFDIDEFVYVEPSTTLEAVVDSLSGYTEFGIKQMRMMFKICRPVSTEEAARTWAIERMVYRDSRKEEVQKSPKYAIQPRNAMAAGVHRAAEKLGGRFEDTVSRIMLFHFHGSVTQKNDQCHHITNATELNFEDTPCVLDERIRSAVPSVKKYELENMGSKQPRQ